MASKQPVLDRRRIQQRFKLRGIMLMKDAVEAVLELMQSQQLTEEALVELITGGIQKQQLKSSILSKADIEALIGAPSNAPTEETNAFSFIDAFDVPKNLYDPLQKRFFKCKDKQSIFADASSKAALYRERLMLLQQRLMRDQDFMRPALALEGSQSHHRELMSLQSLQGGHGPKYVLGAISQLEDGRFFLEDLNSSIPLDLENAVSLAGLYTENSMVVVEGELRSDGVLKANFLGSPIMEKRESSLEFTAGLDFFGGGAPDPENYRKLKAIERNAVEDTFIFISDIWLDNEKTFAKLKTVLDGYEAVPVVPSLFVFIGNFSSHVCSLAFHNFTQLRSLFAKLGAMISSHPRIIEKSQFVFVPGPGDPGPAKVLPRPALPKFFAEEVSKYLPTAVFASNPCRIKWYSQEIVVFREDLLHRMQRACVVPPSKSETTEPFEHLAITVLQQSHLCPLPLTVQPLLWEYDHALRLYPVPDLVVLADSAQQKTFKYEGVTVFNPGSFHSDGTFTFYHPSSRQADENLVED